MPPLFTVNSAASVTERQLTLGVHFVDGVHTSVWPNAFRFRAFGSGATPQMGISPFLDIQMNGPT